MNVPVEAFRDPTDETDGKVPTAGAFGELLGRAGSTPPDRLVAYDDEFGVYASRLLVTAEVFGHDSPGYIPSTATVPPDSAITRQRTDRRT